MVSDVDHPWFNWALPSYIYVTSTLAQKAIGHTLSLERTVNTQVNPKMYQMSSAMANPEGLSVTERQCNHKNGHKALDPSTPTTTTTPSEFHPCALLLCELKRDIIQFALEDAMPADAPRNVIVTLSISTGHLVVPRFSQRPKSINKYTVQYTGLPAVELVSRSFQAEVLWLTRHKSIVPLVPVLTHPTTGKSLCVPFQPSTSTLTLRLEKSSSLNRRIPAFTPF
jgi:hypothetical protein